MSNSIKLSCVTATYNAINAGNKDNLIRCVQSIAAIPIPHEHLVYDGASTDGTAELLKKLEMTTPGLKVVSEKDSGIYNALNKGVRDASGEWFYVLGGDDYIFDPKQMAKAVASGDFKKVDMIGSYNCAGDEKRYIGGKHRKRLLLGSPYSHQAIIMRTNVVRDLNGFDESYKIAADFDLIQRFFLRGYKLIEVKPPYCCTGQNGVSKQKRPSGSAPSESEIIIAKRFKLSSNELDVFRHKRLFPIRVLWRLLFHENEPVRCSARYNLCRKILSVVGLVDDAGKVRI